MPDLSSAFNKRNLRLGLAGVLASVSLAGMAAPAHAQEAAPSATTATTSAAPDSAPDSRRDSRASGTTTTLDRNTCMETTVNNKRNNFLIFGNSRSSTTTTYNEECGRDRLAMTRNGSIAQLMSATNADGSPDITMRAMGLQLYRQSSDEARQQVDAMLLANGLDAEKVVLSITPTGSAAVCVRQPAPAATAGTPVRVSVSFRCTAPGATAAPAVPAAADGTATSTTGTTTPVIGTPDVTGTTVANAAAPAAPAPRP